MSAFKNFHLAFCFQSIGEKEEGKKQNWRRLSRWLLNSWRWEKPNKEKWIKLNSHFTYSRYSVTKWREQADHDQGCVLWSSIRDIMCCEVLPSSFRNLLHLVSSSCGILNLIVWKRNCMKGKQNDNRYNLSQEISA